MPLTSSQLPKPVDRRAYIALTEVLRKLGLIGRVAPPDHQLVRIAETYAKPVTIGMLVVADNGEVVNFAECLGPPSELDKSIPF